MKKFVINSKSGKQLAEVFCYLDESFEDNKEDFLNKLSGKIPKKQNIDLEEYDRILWLKENLAWHIFGFKKPEENMRNIKISDMQIAKAIGAAGDILDACENFIDKKLYVFLFPTFDSFINEKLNGSSGISPHKRVIVVFTNLSNKKWEASFKGTICHELAHALSPYYDMGTLTVGQGIVFDGVAEHLREYIIPNDEVPYRKIVSKQKALSFFAELKSKLDVSDRSFYFEVFYGTGKYPLWLGYTLGYYLVGDYLKGTTTPDWNKILRHKPETILNEIMLNLKKGENRE